MTGIHAQRALTPQGWQQDVRLEIDGGRIAALAAGVPAQPGDERHAILLPGMPNLHSHAFQRSMAGLAEVRGPGPDSFWSWRTLMYRFALALTPDQVEAIASQLYMEMLEAGFSRVGEFHYLHHAPDGRPYADPAEMAARIAAAAAETGIGLTLLPVFYAHSGFGSAAPADGQRRFINDLDRFARLLDGCRAAVADLPAARVGLAPHSLRAVTPEELAHLIPLAGDAPVHIHIAEQVKEVEDCLAWSGARPVQWLFDHCAVTPNWCLVHATHMTADETARLAQSGAVAGLCPITEANLGDGIFDAVPFTEAGGVFGIGSDSNILIGLPDELRLLEYSQRFKHRSRNVMTRAGQSTGRRLFEDALLGGGRALGTKVGLAPDHPADFISLTATGIATMPDDAILDAWIFANQGRPDCVWVAGRKQVAGGRHRQRDAIERRFHATMAALLALA
ncbi:N-formimino-L-glutamate deiminase [Elstera litoralis]|uniref:N-formimino-L-glutamate deiminase n=1 Tax=Elstera litoralis TaxID=552518 RepID=A0A0F3ISC9_9PROT|nr:formimidoylglutamate deiminase [Elstera litoralis]KJV09630.1 N-formimino-L-glutamate deiminase [Elstera litoralis]